MKIPPINTLGRFVVRKHRNNNIPASITSPIKTDTVSFSASIARYLKKYVTLPEEIKNILSPQDAIHMFRNMELIQSGSMEGVKIGQGNHAIIYKNPWLDDKYYSLIVCDPSRKTQVVYSRYELGEAIWQDKDNVSIQIIKKGKAA